MLTKVYRGVKPFLKNLLLTWLWLTSFYDVQNGGYRYTAMWFYELNSNKQRKLMVRGVEQSEKGNCYKRWQYYRHLRTGWSQLMSLTNINLARLTNAFNNWLCRTISHNCASNPFVFYWIIIALLRYLSELLSISFAVIKISKGTRNNSSVSNAASADFHCKTKISIITPH